MRPRTPSPADILDPQTREFYLRALSIIDDASIPYVVGGAYALAYHAGIVRHTKDLDLFLKRQDVPRALDVFESAGYRTEMTHPHWLGKVHGDDAFIDLIFGSGNGLCLVDQEWLDHAVSGEVLGRPAPLSPAEEIIWSKSFIQERNRFDGADVNHMLLHSAERLDWRRLLQRFGEHQAVLLAHLVLFTYVYPHARSRIPAWVLDELIEHARTANGVDDAVCRGTLLSWEQYLPDIRQHGYRDGRLRPEGGNLTSDQVQRWTKADK